jgi:DNA polymerase III subunit epsilon
VLNTTRDKPHPSCYDQPMTDTPKAPASPECQQTSIMPWRDLTYVGFDTETSGKYPLTAEICEIAAVKWKNGQVIDEFHTLIKPTQPMGAEVIAIHGITNDMVENAPRIEDKIAEFHKFIQGAIPVAHHAPFDLGFIAIEFEKAGLSLPEMPVLCSSLLSRKLFPESTNHRLQTLIQFFKLPQGAAHRALDDAKACLEVGLRCLEKSADAPLGETMLHQGGPLTWLRFSMRALNDENSEAKKLIEAVKAQKIVTMTYSAGSTPGESRRVHPVGVVRSLDGDFLVAYDEKDQRSKRYFIEKISNVESVN